jgi:NNP family nitrate/nitrite transporter-like MFS transporter
MAAAAASAGFGGGNFASSMANISYFFPDKEKGFALGLNAAGGNIGVSTVQLLVPVIIGYSLISGTSGGIHLESAGLFWIPLILGSALAAALLMDNLSVSRTSARSQLAITRRQHTWILSFLYIGTFGSFVGFSAAFPLLLRTEHPELTTNLAFLGPLVGSLARPFGGKLADRLGGARVTLWTFLAMMLAAGALLWSLEQHSLPLFLGTFLVLFVTTGVGNGSTFRMIPTVFREFHLGRAPKDEDAAVAVALATARHESAAVVGFTAAIGALGGYFVPRLLGASIKTTGGPGFAIACFLIFYSTCLLTTWWCYLRRPQTDRSPSLAAARA